MDMQAFYNKYCLLCGSQRCEQEGEWLEGCLHFRRERAKEENENGLRRPEKGISKANKGQ